MKALVFDPPRAGWLTARLAAAVHRGALPGRLGGLSLRDVAPPPLPRDDWVRLRTRLGGICGTDVALVTLRHHPATMLQRFASFPAVLGHENVAVIDEIGPDVRGWRRGQRVCVEPSLSCEPRRIDPPCAQCAAGRVSLCENTDRGDLPPGQMIGLNSATGGSWSASFVAHQSQLYEVPDEIPDDVAVLTDPIACAVHSVLRRRPEEDERVLINGGGIVAIGVAAAIRALGCANRVVSIVRHPFQAALMWQFGADIVQIHRARASHAERYDEVAAAVGGRRLAVRFGNQALVGGFDLTYDCVGSGRSLTDAMKWTRPRGTVVALGTSQIAIVETTPLWFSELNLIGGSGRQIEEFDGRRMHTYELVFEWVKSGRLKLDGLLTHRFALRDYRAAFSALRQRGRNAVVKAAFVPAAG